MTVITNLNPIEIESVEKFFDDLAKFHHVVSRDKDTLTVGCDSGRVVFRAGDGTVTLDNGAIVMRIAVVA
jgi:hypothetical protein